jgi:hypothetical protein
MCDERNPAALATGGASEKVRSGRTSNSVANIAAVVEPAECHGGFRAYVGGRVIVASSRQPFLDAARVLIGEGHNPRTILEMRHVGTDHIALCSPLWAAAKLDVKDGKFVNHMPGLRGRAKADESRVHAIVRSRHA